MVLFTLCCFHGIVVRFVLEFFYCKLIMFVLIIRFSRIEMSSEGDHVPSIAEMSSEGDQVPSTAGQSSTPSVGDGQHEVGAGMVS